jgi:hypothetical protein
MGVNAAAVVLGGFRAGGHWCRLESEDALAMANGQQCLMSLAARNDVVSYLIYAHIRNYIRIRSILTLG